MVYKNFGGAAFKGIVTSHQHPFYRIACEDGDSEDLTSKELAKALHITRADVADPRRFTYDWRNLNLGAVPEFVALLENYMAEFGMDLPTAWTEKQGDGGYASEAQTTTFYA